VRSASALTHAGCRHPRIRKLDRWQFKYFPDDEATLNNEGSMSAEAGAEIPNPRLGVRCSVREPDADLVFQRLNLLRERRLCRPARQRG
jgi:hypothetical protein